MNALEQTRSCLKDVSAIAFSAATILFTSAALAAPITNTTLGAVQGIEDAPGLLEFRGIPYAASTGGANRFLPPQPRAPWAGILDGSQFGASCPQGSGAVTTGQSEDCLFLNVFTHSLVGSRPVLVNLHGGAWAAGSGIVTDTNSYWNKAVVEHEDVVIVSPNHRLNVFGYLSLDPASFGPKYAYSGNVGMMDLAAALRWIRDNIKNFGGDPNNVLIYGDSGGGAKTIHALAMPMFKGLFQHAAVFAAHDAWKRNSLAWARYGSAAVLAELGIRPGDIATLQAVPMGSLLAALSRARTVIGPDPANQLPRVNYDLLAPVIDGVTLPEYPIDAVAHGASSNVDLIVGNSRMEHWNVLTPPTQGWTTFDELGTILQPYLAERTNSVIAAYRKVMPGASPSSLLHQILNDRDWNLPHLQLARAKALGGKPGYFYFYDMDISTSIFGLGPSVKNETNQGNENLPGFNVTVGQFVTAFINLAVSGDPNQPKNDQGLPKWPPYTSHRLSQRAMMVFGLDPYVARPLRTLTIGDDGDDDASGSER